MDLKLIFSQLATYMLSVKDCNRTTTTMPSETTTYTRQPSTGTETVSDKKELNTTAWKEFTTRSDINDSRIVANLTTASVKFETTTSEKNMTCYYDYVCD